MTYLEVISLAYNAESFILSELRIMIVTYMI